MATQIGMITRKEAQCIFHNLYWDTGFTKLHDHANTMLGMLSDCTPIADIKQHVKANVKGDAKHVFMAILERIEETE